MFKLSGFKTKKIITTGISLTRLRTSNGKSQQALVSKSSYDELLRNKMETKWHLKFAKVTINKLLTIIGKGDNLKGWFVKN